MAWSTAFASPAGFDEDDRFRIDSVVATGTSLGAGGATELFLAGERGGGVDRGLVFRGARVICGLKVHSSALNFSARSRCFSLKARDAAYMGHAGGEHMQSEV